ncbi:hypothetical Protein YC6258_01797 [Gynuella sunshinyii YC6258]|uniref:Uncharacterized protein n=1 Tax=Gynuella sunshinyii YC6258 TaxID=1445510 RepID=A0A0C5VHW0_9GAMM|nr:hypothetical Protein YC6258_01797 [Gynuella sunshinyii YC6258]
MKKWIPGLSISSGGNWSWSSCNTRSETITCSPNQGYAGRAEIIFAERYGKTDFTGYNKYFSNRNNGCKRGFSFQSSDGFYGWCVPSTFSSNGYWPEKRYSQCTYRKL